MLDNLKENGYSTRLLIFSKIYNANKKIAKESKLISAKEIDNLGDVFVKSSYYAGNVFLCIYNLLESPINFWRIFKQPNKLESANPCMFLCQLYLLQ